MNTYRYRFLNETKLLDALNRIGPAGLFDFLLPHTQDFVDIFGREYVTTLRTAFVARISPLYGNDLETGLLYNAVNTLWADCGKYIDIAITTDDEQRVGRFFAYIATHIWRLDNQWEEAIRQIDAGEFLFEAIRKKHIVTLMSEPDYVADHFVKRIAFRCTPGAKMKGLLDLSVGRIARKECRRDIGWAKRQNLDEVAHIVDWLVTAVRTHADWLSKLDEQGRPKKLMKFGSLDAMHAEAEKQMRKLLTDERPKLGKSDEEDFADEGGEFYLVRMKTPKALRNESNAMRHCVGHGSYDCRLTENRSLMLSLRDRKGWPHMTIEVANGSVVQARGKANSQPKQVHAAAAHRLLDIRDFNGRASSYLLKFVDGPV